tara:strand:- start:1708 stop:2115 length:408 start_codon:yes stop_codon:yes gene_type:complete
MLALGTGMIAWIMTLGAGLGLAGGWFGFRWRHKGRVFSESDREYFQNLLYRAETAEGKLEQMEPELARTSDRANILEDSHRVIQEELANERQFTLSLNGELARLAKRIDKNTQTLAESLPATRDAGEPTFTAASH